MVHVTLYLQNDRVYVFSKRIKMVIKYNMGCAALKYFNFIRYNLLYRYAAIIEPSKDSGVFGVLDHLSKLSLYLRDRNTPRSLPSL